MTDPLYIVWPGGITWTFGSHEYCGFYLRYWENTSGCCENYRRTRLPVLPVILHDGLNAWWQLSVNSYIQRSCDYREGFSSLIGLPVGPGLWPCRLLQIALGCIYGNNGRVASNNVILLPSHAFTIFHHADLMVKVTYYLLKNMSTHSWLHFQVDCHQTSYL